MTKAANNQELPILPEAEDKVKESKAIGRILRRKYKSDNGKEIGDSTDLANLSLADLKVSTPVDRIAEGASASASSSAAVRKIDDWILRDYDDPLSVIHRRSYNPDMVSRRLDSIARLITGEDTCAAVAFDGKNILYSNNSGKANPIGQQVFELLSKVAIAERTIDSIKSDRELNRQMELIAKTGAHQMAESKKIRKGSQGKDILKKQYETTLLKDIKKVVSSLATDSNEKFPEELAQAFKDPKRFEFVSWRNEASLGVVHAEMAILDRVVGRDGIEVYDRDVNAGSKPFYIGLTMLCCKDCRNAVVAYNEVSAEESKSGIADDSLFQAVGVRGQHLQKYDNWTPPGFFERRPAVAEKYKEIKDRGQKYNPGGGKVFADNSESDPEIDADNSDSTPKINAAKRHKSAQTPLPSALQGVASRLSTPISMNPMSKAIAGADVNPRDIGSFSPIAPANNAGQRSNQKKRKEI